MYRKALVLLLILLSFVFNNLVQIIAQDMDAEEILATLRGDIELFQEDQNSTELCLLWGCPLPGPTPDPDCPYCEPGFQIIAQDIDLTIPVEDIEHILPFGVNINDMVLAFYEDSNPTEFVFEFDKNGVTIDVQTAASLSGIYNWRIIEGDQFSPDASLEDITPLTGGRALVVESMPEVISTFENMFTASQSDEVSAANYYGLLSQVNAIQWQFGEAHDNANKAFESAIYTDSTKTIYNTWILTENYTPPSLRNPTLSIIPGLHIEDVPDDLRNSSFEQQIFQLENQP